MEILIALAVTIILIGIVSDFSTRHAIREGDPSRCKQCNDFPEIQRREAATKPRR